LRMRTGKTAHQAVGGKGSKKAIVVGKGGGGNSGSWSKVKRETNHDVGIKKKGRRANFVIVVQYT